MIKPKEEENEGIIWFFAWLECNPKKKEDENKKRKEKHFWAKPRQTTIHTSSRKEEGAKTNQMMWGNHGYNHWI